MKTDTKTFNKTAYVSPSSEALNIRPNRPVLQSGTLGKVSEGSSDEDWYD